MNKHLQITTGKAGHQLETIYMDEPRHIEPVGEPHETFKAALLHGATTAALLNVPLYNAGYIIAGPDSPEVGLAWRYHQQCCAWEGGYGLDARWERRYESEPSEQYTSYVGGN